MCSCAVWTEGNYRPPKASGSSLDFQRPHLLHFFYPSQASAQNKANRPTGIYFEPTLLQHLHSFCCPSWCLHVLVHELAGVGTERCFSWVHWWCYSSRRPFPQAQCLWLQICFGSSGQDMVISPAIPLCSLSPIFQPLSEALVYPDHFSTSLPFMELSITGKCCVWWRLCGLWTHINMCVCIFNFIISCWVTAISKLLPYYLLITRLLQTVSEALGK